MAGALVGAKRQVGGRLGRRPSRFADAGVTLLRTSGENEIWCRCDGGPHGYLSIAAHAHADALSVEVRYAGIDILADPGTFQVRTATTASARGAHISGRRSRTILPNSAAGASPASVVRSCGRVMRKPARSR
jgi:hypothetical protein